MSLKEPRGWALACNSASQLQKPLLKVDAVTSKLSSSAGHCHPVHYLVFINYVSFKIEIKRLAITYRLATANLLSIMLNFYIIMYLQFLNDCNIGMKMIHCF